MASDENQRKKPPVPLRVKIFKFIEIIIWNLVLFVASWIAFIWIWLTTWVVNKYVRPLFDSDEVLGDLWAVLTLMGYCVGSILVFSSLIAVCLALCQLITYGCSKLYPHVDPINENQGATASGSGSIPPQQEQQSVA